MSRASFWLIAAVLFVATSVTHLWMIGSAPTGFFNDECANAYNAYCILETGADEYGTSYPLFFRCMDDYRDSVLIYSIVPAVKLLGLTKTAARLPNALYFIAASIAFVFLSYEYCRNKWVALAGGTLFSFIPWTLNFSRTAVAGYAPMLLGMILGWLLLVVALRRRCWQLAVPAGMAWAFAMYSYYVGRPMTVVLIVCFLAAFVSESIPYRRVFLTFLVSLVLSMVPMMIGVWRNPHVLTARFHEISIFRQVPLGLKAAMPIAASYLDYFDPRFLFWRGDPILRHGTGAGGVLFMFLAPLVVAGFYAIARQWRSDLRYRFLLLGLLAYPAAAVLANDHMHSGRSINGVIFWVLVAVVGIHRLLLRRRLAGQVAVALIFLFGVGEIRRFYGDYFGAYQTRARDAFQSQLTEPLEFCFEHLGTNDTFYISESFFELLIRKDNALMPLVDEDFHAPVYEDLLFFGKIPPRIYQRQGIPKDRVRLYDGTASRPGLLLRGTHWVAWRLGTDECLLFPNKEPLPPQACLIKTFPSISYTRREIYKIP